MQMDFGPEQVALRRQVRGLIDEHVADDWQTMFIDEDTWRQTLDFCAVLADHDLLTPSWPAEHGGRASSIWDDLVIAEEMWADNEPRGPQYMNVNWIGPAIMHFGTAEQQAHFLPRMSRGEIVWGQGFSEPEAGSDLAGLRTTAVLDGDHFVVNGTKVWQSYGDIADYYFLLVRSQPGSTRSAGMSVLLVDMSLPGISVSEFDTVLGRHRITETAFQDARIPVSSLLGTMHDGWNVVRQALAYERVGIPQYSRAVRVLSRLAEEYGADWDPTAVREFAQSVAYARAAELTTYRAADAKASGTMRPEISSVARLHNALLERRVAETSERLGRRALLVGGSDAGAVAHGEIETHWRNAPTVPVAAGSVEIQMEIVAANGLGLPRKAQ